MTEAEIKLLAKWEIDLRVICHGHYYTATRMDQSGYWIGIPAIVLASAAGSSALVQLSVDAELSPNVVSSTAALVAAVLASAQLFLRLPERAERHRAVGARFGALLREVEQIIASPPSEAKELEPWCSSLRCRWDEIARDTVAVPQRIWRKMHARYSPDNDA